ncbi:hypothetical protein [Candidatus Binatus soli]|jgi:hypothetical protein|uniref:hypothetical protein n=1 Tax=Candidatus Binatus soli TaxID=1953413 RepID=UPI003D0B0FB2
MAQPAPIWNEPEGPHSKEWRRDLPLKGKAWGRYKEPTKLLERIIGQLQVDQSDRLKIDFQKFTSLWKSAQSSASAPEDIAGDWPYRAIIALGPEVVPLILRELEREPDDWFWALAILTGENPVPENDRGKMLEMTKAWLKWGRENNKL